MYDYSKLYARMAELGITREELARRMKISRSTLYAKLNSKTEFTQSEIWNCVQILNLDIRKLDRYFFRQKSFESKTKHKEEFI